MVPSPYLAVLVSGCVSVVLVELPWLVVELGCELTMYDVLQAMAEVRLTEARLSST